MLYVHGKLKGTRSEVITTQNNSFTKHYVGIASIEDDGYGGKREIVTEISMSENDVKSGFAKALEAYQNKDIMLPVYVGTWVNSRSKQAQFQYNYDTKREIISKDSALKAA